MIVIIRLDLDKYDLGKLNDLVRDGIVSISEATEAKVFKELGAYQQLLQVRYWQRSLVAGSLAS